jgi:hypothetical protein
MEEAPLNAFEQAYKKANSITEFAITRDQWIGLLIPILVMSAAKLSGYPERYTSPAALFLLMSGWMLLKRGKEPWKHVLWNLVGALVLYAFLAYFSHPRL